VVSRSRGVLWKVVRPRRLAQNDQHSSEQQLGYLCDEDFAAVIVNDGDLDQLAIKVRQLLSSPEPGPAGSQRIVDPARTDASGPNWWVFGLSSG
jgi:hypothetical protein